MLLTITRLLRLYRFYLNKYFVQMPLSRRRVLHLRTMVRPLTINPRRIVRVICLITINRTRTLFHMSIFQLRLRRFSSLGNTLWMFVLQGTLIQTFPTHRRYLRRRIFSQSLLFRMYFLLPHLFPLADVHSGLKRIGRGFVGFL